jgi:hypothetical protein
MLAATASAAPDPAVGVGNVSLRAPAAKIEGAKFYEFCDSSGPPPKGCYKPNELELVVYERARKWEFTNGVGGSIKERPNDNFTYFVYENGYCNGCYLKDLKTQTRYTEGTVYNASGELQPTTWHARSVAIGPVTVTPHAGPSFGGTSVTITGAEFSEVSAVKFGAVNAATFTVNSESSITAVSPAGSGTVAVTVATPFGTSVPSPADQFTYETGYGQCLRISPVTGKRVKNTNYRDPACTVMANPAHPHGKYQWFPGPAARCIALKRKTGNYTDAACTKKANPLHPHGRYEKAAGPGYTSTGGEATLETPSLHVTVRCTASSNLGEVTDPMTDVDRITFTGCEASKQKCTSLEGAQAEGEIVTYGLETKLILSSEVGLSGKKPAAGEVWTEFANVVGAHAPYLAAYECGKGTFFRTRGSLSGVTTENINKMSFKNQGLARILVNRPS